MQIILPKSHSALQHGVIRHGIGTISDAWEDTEVSDPWFLSPKSPQSKAQNRSLPKPRFLVGDSASPLFKCQRDRKREKRCSRPWLFFYSFKRDLLSGCCLSGIAPGAGELMAKVHTLTPAFMELTSKEVVNRTIRWTIQHVGR